MRGCFGLMVVAALGLGGCGDDTGVFDSSVSMDLSAAQDLSGTMNADLAGLHSATVAPNGTLTFAPSSLTIAAGDTVMWTWAVGGHTVTSGSGTADGKFCSGAPTNPSMAACAGEAGEPAGFTYSHRFPAAGTFPYFCNVHGSIMAGTVIVQ